MAALEDTFRTIGTIYQGLWSAPAALRAYVMGRGISSSANSREQGEDVALRLRSDQGAGIFRGKNSRKFRSKLR